MTKTVRVFRSLAFAVLLCCSVGVIFAQSAKPETPVQPTIAEKIAAGQTKLDLNTATAEQLKALPGIGDAYVKRIVEGRPYTAKNQLTTRGILPEAVYGRIKDLIIAHRPKPASPAAK